jgi:hypothetical protein
VQKAIQEMRVKNAAGYDDVLEDVLKLLGETGDWPEDFTEVTAIALKN